MCQLSETLQFSAIAPFVVDGQIGFYKNDECTSIEVYNAFTAKLLNINNFGERYGVSFYDMLKYDFSLKSIFLKQTIITCLLSLKT